MVHTQETIHAVVEAQRAFFRTGATLDVNERIAQLKDVLDALRKKYGDDDRYSNCNAPTPFAPSEVRADRFITGLVFPEGTPAEKRNT